MRLIAKPIRISHDKFLCNRLKLYDIFKIMKHSRCRAACRRQLRFLIFLFYAGTSGTVFTVTFFK